VESPDGAACALLQNRPNPFDGSTDIGFALAEDTSVSLEVFDLRGRKVATLATARWSAGVHHVRFGGRTAGGGALAAGVYFYRLRAGGFVATRRMLLTP